MPFWFLNGDLDEEKMKLQLRDFKAHGLDGVILHPRMGLADDIEYLGERYLILMRKIVEEACRLEMKVMLYDEAMYPSGSADGLVVKGNPEYAARAIRLERFPLDTPGQCLPCGEGEEVLVAVAVLQQEERVDLSKAVILQTGEHGLVYTSSELMLRYGWRGYAVIAGYSHGTMRGVHFGEDDGEPHAPRAADILNPEAMRKFIHITYEAYYKALQGQFGRTIVGFYTDEPSMMGRCVNKKKYRPWSQDFLRSYVRAGNKPEHLLALWLDVGEETAALRRNYRRALNDRLEESYYQQLADWCTSHHVALAGHPAYPEDIGVLRHFRIPGQDIMWRWVAPERGRNILGSSSTLAKCASDAARHHGQRRNLCEFLGACGPAGQPWALTAGDMKWYMDWLFVRGTNMLVPHAFWYSVEGEKRCSDRPPDVGPHNTWWPYYQHFADYAKRLSWLNTDSHNTTQVAVLCEEERLPWRIVQPLYEQQIEFNYLEDELLRTGEAVIEDGAICIAQQHYTVLLLEQPETVEASARARIEAFQQQGGTVYTAADDVTEKLIAAHCREARLIPECRDIRLTHVQKAGKSFYLFTNEGEHAFSGRVELYEQGGAELWDAWSGATQPAEVTATAEQSLTLVLQLPPRSSRIIVIDPASSASAPTPVRSQQIAVQPLRDGWQWRHPETNDWLPVRTMDDWTLGPALRDYCGAIDYVHELDLPARVEGLRVCVDLGMVGELAEIIIEGYSLDVSLWAPYVIDITDALWDKPRHVRMIVRVTSSVSHRYTDKIRPAGLMGPVKLQFIREQQEG